jgi:hypothetical protein
MRGRTASCFRCSARSPATCQAPGICGLQHGTTSEDTSFMQCGCSIGARQCQDFESPARKIAWFTSDGGEMNRPNYFRFLRRNNPRGKKHCKIGGPNQPADHSTSTILLLEASLHDEHAPPCSGIFSRRRHRQVVRDPSFASLKNLLVLLREITLVPIQRDDNNQGLLR